ncbi:serine O-acetyltransferase [Azospirillum sp. TSO22-1]|uniref:serine O-acetyltransferase n=1 Tax=Azospirillum sp. TSO22-1 TaxID=716789 RepID=UPI000D610DD6|nr:serine O-acetyltransferase [Azospirillum sp. TSO22-1]PWC53020.1 serine acetyltransferase [Azospirillum sp. TSO22-1]
MDGLITTTTEAEAWDRLRAEAAAAAAGEAMLRGVMESAVLAHHGPEAALSACLARRLAGPDVGREQLGELVDSALRGDPRILGAAFADLAAIVARDPAADGWLTPFLHFKGFHALQWHRVAHWLWNDGRHALAHYLQNRVSEVYAVDIHPAVPVGRGVFIDHGTGVVVGETAVIGNDVSILQNVTLGGTGKEHGDRHPKVRDGVLLSAGAKVLGNIEIGARAKVGAGSVVLKSVPPCATVAGVPARIVGWCSGMVPGVDMDQSLGDDYQNLGIDI